ncbi:MAG TPA: alpha-glucan family phosphorylase, partial [Blastocatellia bacterium]
MCSMLPLDVDGVESAAELALDLRYSWKHTTDEIWRQLDPDLWELTRNPWVVLQTVSRDTLERACSDNAFREKIAAMLEARKQAEESPAWFQLNHSGSALTSVAYFSMEFMLSEALPIYSGGLGNVAGDQLKSASDLGVPVIGIGLLYQQGYFRQVIEQDGTQEALYPYNDPGQLPITPLRESNGEWLRLEVKLPGYSLWLRVWQAQVGRVKLYLMDSNDAANFPAHRGITSELYGGGTELRIKQELALGIGGWRLVNALGTRPEVCHLNEGHAAFAVLERARTFMEETGQPFDAALAATRAGNLFTTHTPVEAGFDRFDPALVEQYLGWYARQRLGISTRDLLALGRQNPDDSSEPFNMAYLAVRGSGSVNGVSRLHSEVSRAIFQPLFPRWPEDEVPVGYVTNGVHVPSWDSALADGLWTKVAGNDRWLGTLEHLTEEIHGLSDEELWELRSESRKTFVEFVRGRLARQLTATGASPEQIEVARRLFDPGILTLCFARRFATYKRPTLLLHDQNRLLRILTNPERPVQLVIAGKAHPADGPGKSLIQQWVHFIRNQARAHTVFLSDYDMLLTERLVQGVDVWLNTPRRPWEASGTSGMKVLVNGGLNLSELDGWWAEAYEPEVGWAIGDGREHGDDPAWDAAEAEDLYRLLEQQVVPEFYNRDEKGIPKAWVARMRESMARLTPRFSANRVVREYTDEHYVRAAGAYRERAVGNGIEGRKIANWKSDLDRGWDKIHFGEMKVKTADNTHTFDLLIYLNGVHPNSVRVELYADAREAGVPVRQEMTRSGDLYGPENAYVYSAQVPSTRPAGDFTARVIP